MITSAGVSLAERGMLPLSLLRWGTRQLCAERLRTLDRASSERFAAGLGAAPLALVPETANAQHYEVPAAFFELVLGAHQKYSSAWWPEGVTDLDAAERAMLDLTMERAGLTDGARILELGCGWGSLTRAMGSRFPHARIEAVSNSLSQRAFIASAAPSNVRLWTADINTFEPSGTFDRIVSVEMFEHVRNWPALLARVHRWLRPGGTAFVHVFCHAQHAYPFEGKGTSDWMARHFFTGGLMPSYDLLPRLAPPLELEQRWWIDGTHYARTAAAWRERLETRRDAVMAVLRLHYGAEADRWFHRWRLFFLACEELFGFAGGTEWGVGHYLLRRSEEG